MNRKPTRVKKQMISVYPIRSINDDWQHLIIKRKKLSYNWQCVTGGVESNETPLTGAHRELFEETGYKTSLMIPYSCPPDYFVDDEPVGNHDDELLQYTLKRYDIFVFIAIITDPKDPILSPREHTAWKWCDFDTAYQMVDWAIEKKGHRFIRDFINSKNLNRST